MMQITSTYALILICAILKLPKNTITKLSI